MPFRGKLSRRFEDDPSLGYDWQSFKANDNMAGLDQNTPSPTNITLHQKSKKLEVAFDNGRAFVLPAEFLRVYSPSAEVRGHGPGQETLQQGKRHVGIDGIEPVGNYAVKLIFSDGHDSGLYSWDYLYSLGEQQDSLWQTYLERLEQAAGSRDITDQPPSQPHAAGCAQKNG